RARVRCAARRAPAGQPRHAHRRGPRDRRVRPRGPGPHRPAGAPARGDRRLRELVPMTGAVACFHCGEPVEQPGRWTARVEGIEREMCCAGCQAVANAIVAAGLDDYYRARSAPAPGAAVVPPALRALEVYDDADVQARFVRNRDADCEATLMIDGLRCGACVWLLEQGLRRRPGVSNASVNLATNRATLRWDPSKTRLSSLLDAIGHLGYRALPFDAREREAQIQRTTKALL